MFLHVHNYSGTISESSDAGIGLNRSLSCETWVLNWLSLEVAWIAHRQHSNHLPTVCNFKGKSMENTGLAQQRPIQADSRTDLSEMVHITCGSMKIINSRSFTVPKLAIESIKKHWPYDLFYCRKFSNYLNTLRNICFYRYTITTFKIISGAKRLVRLWLTIFRNEC